jgi:multidrug efflux pump subunit AcrB
MIGGVRAAKFTDKGHRFDVRVRLLSDARNKPEDVKRLFVRGREGGLVRLSQVVDLKEQPTIQSITRRDRVRAITLTANLAAGASQHEALEQVRKMARETLPEGYGIMMTGSSKLFDEAGNAFLLAIGLGALIAYMILASQFNSFTHPFLVLLAMPFSITGAIVAMMLAGVSFNLYSMIGFVLLMGIVKKNSILLVDFTNQLRSEGRSVMDALRAACPIRLRPILMTSVATIAAALPPAFAMGAGLETIRSMAVVVIGGVMFSTILTLYVVPCAYALLPGRVRVTEDIERQLAEGPGAEKHEAAPGAKA